MKLEELEQAAGSIRVPQAMQEDILKNVRERMETNLSGETAGKRRAGIPRFVAAAAVVLLVVGSIAVPVRTLVSSLVQERMEAVPEETVQQFWEMTDGRKAEADSFSGAYTDKVQREAQAAEIAAAGGISANEAVTNALEWLGRCYGISGEGLEKNVCLVEGAADGPGEPLYCVNWTDPVNLRYYIFYVYAGDGSLAEAAYSDAELTALEQTEISGSRMKEKLPVLEGKAKYFLSEKLGRKLDAYTGSDARYILCDGTQAGNVATFFFQKEGEAGKTAADVLSYAYDGAFVRYLRVSDLDAWRAAQ